MISVTTSVILFAAVNLDEIPTMVHSEEIDADQALSEINVYWDSEVLESVSFVDVIVYGYDEIGGEIVFEPVFTLGEGIDYDLGYSSFAISPQYISFEVGVIGVMDNNTAEG